MCREAWCAAVHGVAKSWSWWAAALKRCLTFRYPTFLFIISWWTLGCFHFWPLWIVLLVYLCTSLRMVIYSELFGFVSRNGILWSYSSSMFNLLRKCCIIYFPISSIWGFHTLNMLANIYVCLFNYSHSSGYEVVSHCGFDLYFPNDYDFKCLLMYLLTICITSLEKYHFRLIFSWRKGYFLLLNFELFMITGSFLNIYVVNLSFYGFYFSLFWLCSFSDNSF